MGEIGRRASGIVVGARRHNFQYQFTESTTMRGEVGASEFDDAAEVLAMGGMFAAPRRPVEGSDDEEDEVDDDGLEEFDEDELDADLDDLDDDDDEDDEDDLDDDEDDLDDDEDDLDDDLDDDEDDLDEDDDEDED
jgi:hypothetical protein